MKTMLLQMEKHLAVLVHRRDRLQKELDEIDNLPLTKVTEQNTQRWHTVFFKIKNLENRIATKRSQMEILNKKKDTIKEILTNPKSIFNYVFGGK